jgi:transposase
MRGNDEKQICMVTLISVEDLIAADHPIRRIRKLVDRALVPLDGIFEEMYAKVGRPSIPPEMLLRAKVLQALYTVRSDRQLCDRLQTDLLFRWFIGLEPDERVFDASTFSQNQTRLLKHEVADVFFAQVVEIAREEEWASNEHFSVDGTLIEAWASKKSFKPKGSSEMGDGNDWTDFSRTTRKNNTHESTSDAEAKLVRKGSGKEAKLSFAAHAAMGNRNGLCVLLDVRGALEATEPEVPQEQLDELHNRGFLPRSVGADRGYHTEAFVREVRNRGVEPHTALPKRRDNYGVVWTAEARGQPAHPQAHRGDLRLDENHGQPAQEPLDRNRENPRSRSIGRSRMEPGADGKTDDATAYHVAGLRTQNMKILAVATTHAFQLDARYRS